MEEKKEIIIGNVTTIVTSISLAFAGLIIGLLTSHGLNLPVSQEALAGVIGTVIMFIFSIINTKYKSTYFTDDDKEIIDISSLNEEQVNAIKNFIDNTTVNVGGRTYNIDYSDDPSLAYEDSDEDGC